MAEVHFYVRAQPDADDPQARWRLAARLCRRLVVQQQQRLQVCLEDVAQQQQFDDWLWTFAASAFVPHALNNPAAALNLVLRADEPQVLNLCTEALLYVPEKTRVLELVAGSDAERAQARLRYRAYQQAGWPLQTFNL